MCVCVCVCVRVKHQCTDAPLRPTSESASCRIPFRTRHKAGSGLDSRASSLPNCTAYLVRPVFALRAPACVCQLCYKWYPRHCTCVFAVSSREVSLLVFLTFGRLHAYMCVRACVCVCLCLVHACACMSVSVHRSRRSLRGPRRRHASPYAACHHQHILPLPVGRTQRGSAHTAVSCGQ